MMMMMMMMIVNLEEIHDAFIQLFLDLHARLSLATIVTISIYCHP